MDVVPVVGLDQIFEISHIRLKPFGSCNFNKCCNHNDLAIVGRSNQANNPVQPPQGPAPANTFSAHFDAHRFSKCYLVVHSKT
jgi:hypothetical protein